MTNKFEEKFNWCKICDSPANLCIVEGNLRVLEVWDKTTEDKRQDWTGSGLFYTPLCEGCYEGLEHKIYKEGGIMELVR